VNTLRLEGASDSVHDEAALRRTISHVVAFSTLSAVWAGAARPTIADSLAQVVREALDCNAVYVGLRVTGSAVACESNRVRHADDQPIVDVIREGLADWMRAPGAAQPVPPPKHRGPLAVTPIGIWAEHGLIAAASNDRDFPSGTDRLLLNVAANQAAVALLTESARALAVENGYLYVEAQRANFAKDQFLATLSHELRTPLNAIMGWLSMLRRPEVMTSEGTPKAWAAVDRNTNALATLIEDLLDVSRIATGKFHLVKSDVDLNEVARDSVRTVEPLFVEKGVLLSVDFSPQPCTLRGDLGRLRQVAGNLLSNALKFTATGGQVGISVRCQETAAILVVTDNGVGVHPDLLPHVFERFRQGDAESRTGLGLGLAIVRDLVELHGGTVSASSGGIGLGSQFTATLPRNTP
jgi:signal transduction histidine kinase